MSVEKSDCQSVVVVQPSKSTTLAGALELVPGFFFQTFGIGHLYAGRYGKGIAIMLGYWGLMALNALLCSFVIGFITAPLTWLAALFFASKSAAGEAHEANEQSTLRLVSGILS